MRDPNPPRARKGYDETLALPGFTVTVKERNGSLVLLIEYPWHGLQQPLGPHEARQIASLLRNGTELDHIPHRSCDEALEAARKELERVIDCGQDPALGCAEAPGCLRCFGNEVAKAQQERDAAIAERDRLRRELEALRDEMREWCHGLDTAACHRAVIYGPTIDRLDAILRGEP